MNKYFYEAKGNFYCWRKFEISEVENFIFEITADLKHRFQWTNHCYTNLMTKMKTIKASTWDAWQLRNRRAFVTHNNLHLNLIWHDPITKKLSLSIINISAVSCFDLGLNIKTNHCFGCETKKTFSNSNSSLPLRLLLLSRSIMYINFNLIYWFEVCEEHFLSFELEMFFTFSLLSNSNPP